MIIKNTVLSFCLLATSFAQAGWQLNNAESNLSFVSIKKDVVAEVHHFTSMQGKVSNSGFAKVVIDLASIESNIDIRNERMKKHLFKVGSFANATIETKFDAKLLSELAEGTSMVTVLPFSLNLHGQKQSFEAQVRVTKLAEQLLVSNISTIIVNAAEFNMVKGIEKLAELAGLPNIAMAVPVNFNLAFKQQ